jgi:hypothetical protein
LASSVDGDDLEAVITRGQVLVFDSTSVRRVPHLLVPLQAVAVDDATQPGPEAHGAELEGELTRGGGNHYLIDSATALVGDDGVNIHRLAAGASRSQVRAGLRLPISYRASIPGPLPGLLRKALDVHPRGTLYACLLVGGCHPGRALRAVGIG